jgi:hypothetical protein
MIWLTWRQFRTQAWVACGGLAALAIAFLVTGPHLASLYSASGIPTCHAHSDCPALAASFQAEVKGTLSVLYHLGVGVLYVVPAVIGLFWGAPLVAREFEAGTFRLAWNQGVTRTRWLAVKLGLIGLASMAAAGLFSLMVTWWSSPIDRAQGIESSRNTASAAARLAPLLFGARGIVPVGYAAFAFALGVTVGVLIRRTIPAMAVTIAAFAAVQIAMPLWIRPHLITPVHTISPFNAAMITELSTQNDGHMTVIEAAKIPGAWVLSDQTINAAGQVFTGPAPQACESSTASFQACQDSLTRLHLRQLVTYQPASRYWAFQWYETAIFLALAVALAGFCYWWVRRRRLA